MDSFEEWLLRCHKTVERFVFYRLPSKSDAEDLLQEIWLTAQQAYPSLRNPQAFRSWILTIAKNKCSEYFRRKAKALELPLDEVEESRLSYWGRETQEDPVGDTLSRLKEKDRQILYLAFFCNYPHVDIAQRLHIPLGTVKSRLHTAKERFRETYPYPPQTKGVISMKALPQSMPPYTITPVNEPPFAVRHEELPGMLILPRLGEKITMGSYDFPAKTLTDWYHLETTGEVMLHGVHGIAIRSVFEDPNGTKEERTIFAQLTEEFCRYLGGVCTDAAGIPHITTFLDEDFAESYAIGDENCGFEVHRVPRGKITAQGNQLSTTETGDVSDIVGRFLVEIDGKTYDTVRLIDLQNSGDSAMLVEYYLDAHGRTVLWRRFNRDDWKMERYGQRWSEKLPTNERLTLNGDLFVHWYDCITDYIL